MTKLLYTTLFLLLAAGLGYLIHKLVEKTKYDLVERYLHCRYIAAFLLFLVIFFNNITFSLVLMLADGIINHQALSGIWSTVMPERRYEVVYLVLILAILNLLMVLAAAILFFIVRKIFENHTQPLDVRKASFSDILRHLPWLFVGMVYEEDEETGFYTLTHRGYIMSFWAKRMKIIPLLLGLGEMVFLLAAIFIESDFLALRAVNLVKGWYMLPVAAYLLLEQIQWCLEGEMDYEAGSFGSEEIKEEWDGNQDLLTVLRDIYINEFAGSQALITSYENEQLNVLRSGLAHNGLNNNQIDDCDQPELLCMFSNQIRELDIKQSTPFQNALVALLNGQSINVRDYVQGEFLIYLAIYMNFFVSQQKTFLLLCENEKRALKIKQELEDVLNRINRIHTVWKVGDIHMADNNDEMQILICSYEDFVNHKLISKRNDFFRNLSAVILTDVMNFSAQGTVQKEVVFTEFEKLRQKIQYIILSQEDNDSLRTSFEYYTNQEILPFKHDFLLDNMMVMIWKEDSCHKIQRHLGIGGKQSAYMGVSIPLALVGAKFDLPQISVFANDQKGYETYRDVMRMEQQEIVKYLRWDMDLEKIILFDRFSIVNRNELEMFILHDSNYNFFSLLWSWMKYGGTKGTMIHIVSPPYMLREYFADNLKTLIARNNEFAPIISYQASLKYSSFLEMLIDLSNAGMYEKTIMRKSKEHKWPYENVTQVLSDCLKHVLKEQEFYNIYECFRFEEKSVFNVEKDRYESHTLVKLTDENIRRRIHEKLAFAKLIIKNNVSCTLPILQDNVYNHYLRDQIVPLGGYMYRITNVNNGAVYAEQMITQDKQEYFQCSEFVLSRLYLDDNCVDQEMIDYNRYHGKVERFIHGYWSCNGQLDFAKENAAKFNNICDANQNPIRVSMSNVHILEIRLKKSGLGEKAEQAAFLAAFMFQEIFKTLFPHNHMNLFAAVEYNPDSCYWETMKNMAGQMPLEEKIHSIVPFFRSSDREREANKDYVRIRILEFSGLEIGMVSSLYKNRKRLFQIVESYLEWYLANADQQSSGIKPSYLNFGMEAMADCFAAEELLDLCRKILPAYTENPAGAAKPMLIQADHACTFCGKPVLISSKMSDGRRMCRSCKLQQVKQKEEIKELYTQTVEFLCRTYHIKLRKNIHLRLQSADSIRKKCQISGAGRVLGFYQPGNHELWIEARGPRNAVQDTMIHELSHAWQFDNVNVRKLKRKYPDKYLLYLEGHASYMEVDAMRKLGEQEYADYLHNQLMNRDDEYGIGYQMLKDYLEAEESKGSHNTPYEALKNLIAAL